MTFERLCKAACDEVQIVADLSTPTGYRDALEAAYSAGWHDARQGPYGWPAADDLDPEDVCPECGGQMWCDLEGDWNHVITKADQVVALTLEHNRKDS